MIVGVPREVKDNEYRVGLVPAGVKALTLAGHTILVETSAGEGSGISDNEFTVAGVRSWTLVKVWGAADMVVKVRDALPSHPSRRPEPVHLLHLARDRTPKSAARSRSYRH